MAEEKRRTNPYDWINPVQNKNTFAGRSEETSDIMDELIKLKGRSPVSPTIAIIGERRIGKTSLLLRVTDLCRQESLPSAIINVDDRMSADPWEFWKEIYYALFAMTHDVGIELISKQARPMGFIISQDNPSAPSDSLVVDDLKFLTTYQIHMSAPNSVTLSYQVVKHDLDLFRDEEERKKKGSGLALHQYPVCCNTTSWPGRCASSILAHFIM